jgi:uncharacterized protein (TIGR00255 family)
MIKSMTGFGRASGEVNGTMVTVEIRSLNSKFLELGLRMPQAFNEKEMEMRSLFMKEFERGKVDVSIVMANATDEQQLTFNHDLITAYIKEFKVIEKENKIAATDYMRVITGLPNVMTAKKTAVDETTWKKIEKLIKAAVLAFNAFRLQEGKLLEEEFTSRLKSIEKHLKIIEKLEPERIKSFRARINQSLAEVAENVKIDQNRFEQEMIYYIEKLDVSEEKFRLRSHCNYYIENLKSKDANGKKLGFIIQEIGREINTLGSKANHAGMQQHVVEMKDDLEKMKEQIANVL